MNVDSELMKRDAVLSELVRGIVSAYQPQRIYLFGSKARGDNDADSDYDLLLVVPDDAQAERLNGRLAHDLLWELGVAADVVIWSRSRFDRRTRVPASLPATVLREGRLLYAA
ncbi:MAG: nucleotidyltransferase domain-containing protein [Actinomycetota bacterium]